MSEKGCPNCGMSVPATAENCTCGYTFVEYDDMPGPGIVRSSAAGQGGAMKAQPDEDTAVREKELPAGSSPAAAEGRPAPPAPAAAARDRGPAAPARPAAAAGDATRPNESMLMACPSCRARISRRAARCPKCGVAPYGQCQVCAGRILANAAPCPECGDPEPFGDTPA